MFLPPRILPCRKSSEGTDHYAIPDAGAKYLESANYEDEKDRFSIKIGVALLTGNTPTFLVRLQWIY
jgi:hypothetical protein